MENGLSSRDEFENDMRDRPWTRSRSLSKSTASRVAVKISAQLNVNVAAQKKITARPEYIVTPEPFMPGSNRHLGTVYNDSRATVGLRPRNGLLFA